MMDELNQAETSTTTETSQAKPLTPIAEYNETAAALASLTAKYQGVIYEVGTKTGMDAAKAARKELKGLRVALEHKRKEIKAPALQRCAEIESEAKRITAVLSGLEKPIDEQITTEEERKAKEKEEKERQERERITTIQSMIAAIRNIPTELTLAQASAEEIAKELAELEAFTPDEKQFAEFVEEAKAAVSTVVASLKALHASKQAQEAVSAQLAAQQEELQRQQAEIDRQRAEMEALRAQQAPQPEAATEPIVELVQEEQREREEKFPLPEHVGMDFAYAAPAYVYDGAVLDTLQDEFTLTKIPHTDIPVALIVEPVKEGTITISMSEYRKLQDDALLLACLRGAGVDNWIGWDDAIDQYNVSLAAA